MKVGDTKQSHSSAGLARCSQLKELFVIFFLCNEVVHSLDDVRPKVQYVRVNSSLWLNCSLESKMLPADRVFWYFNYQPISNNFVTRKGQQMLELNISNVSMKNNGLYLCGYEDSAGNFLPVENYTVIVGDVPKPFDFPQQRCYLQGYPPKVNIWWTHDQSVSQEPNLTYTVFYCKPNSTIRNFCANNQKQFYSTTESCTGIKVSTLINKNLFCNLTNVAKRLFPNIYSLSTDIPSKRLCSRIQARNAFGVYTSNPVCCKLLKVECSRPSKLNFTVTRKQELTIMWHAPVDIRIKGNVLFYTIIYSAKDDEQNQTVHVPFLGKQKVLSFTLKGLRPYARYAIYVACGLTKFNINHPAGPVIAQTLEEAPSAAPIINSTKLVEKTENKRSVKIYWELPSTEFLNGRPEKIVVEYWKRYPEGSLNKTEFMNVTVNNGSAESVVLKGLDLYRNYSVAVRLCTRGGCSVRSQVFPILAEINKDKTSADDHFLQLVVGLGVGLPLLVILVVVIIIVCLRKINANNGARPLSRIVADLQITRDPYEEIARHPTLVEEQNDYEDDPPESQEVLAVKKLLPCRNSRSSVASNEGSTESTLHQIIGAEEERYVVMEECKRRNARTSSR